MLSGRIHRKWSVTDYLAKNARNQKESLCLMHL
jgi:hypothetical protein